MGIIYPDRLYPGAKIGITSPAGAVRPEYIEGAAQVIAESGFIPVIMPHAKERYGSYSGSLENRLADFMAALTDNDIKAIMCGRGGYGAVHLLEYLPESIITQNPKWLIGFSDISALHAAWWHAGVASLHAPMCKHLTLRGENDSYTQLLFKTLCGEKLTYKTTPNGLNRTGVATGSIIGGNFAVLSALIGSKYDIFRQKDMILFIEDISEPVYKVERMLYTLKLNGVFENIRGMIVGQFCNYTADKDNDEDIPMMISRMTANYDIPISFDFPIGHVDENVTIIEGGDVKLSVTNIGTELKFI